MRNIVLVKGNIIGTAGHQHATEWVALAPESWEGEAAQVIEGDLVLDEKGIMGDGSSDHFRIIINFLCKTKRP